jgi:hypothetical protein
MITAAEKRKEVRRSAIYESLKERLEEAKGRSTKFVVTGKPLAKYILKALKKNGYTVKCQYSQRKAINYRESFKSYTTKSGKIRHKWTRWRSSERVIKRWTYKISW